MLDMAIFIIVDQDDWKIFIYLFCFQIEFYSNLIYTYVYVKLIFRDLNSSHCLPPNKHLYL